MTNARPPITGRDVAGAGALLLAVNLACAAAGAGVGALVGATVPLMLLHRLSSPHDVFHPEIVPIATYALGVMLVGMVDDVLGAG